MTVSELRLRRSHLLSRRVGYLPHSQTGRLFLRVAVRSCGAGGAGGGLLPVAGRPFASRLGTQGADPVQLRSVEDLLGGRVETGTRSGPQDVCPSQIPAVPDGSGRAAAESIRRSENRRLHWR